MNFSWRRNIYALYVIKLSKWLMLIMPIVALFYHDNGLAELDIYLLQAVYSISLAILEIPSGYMADMLGKKKTLLLGAVLGTLGFALYSCSFTFTGFLVAEIILGIGGSFISGSDTAILFDTLNAADMRQKYLRFEGRVTALGSFAETLAALLGGLLAAWLSYRAVYAAQTMVAAAAIPAALLLREPPGAQREKQQFTLHHIAQICHYALIENRPLAAAIFHSSVTGIATLCMAWTAQIYFVNKGFNEYQITSLWVTLNLLVAFVSVFAGLIDKKIQTAGGDHGRLALIAITIPCGYIALGALPTGAALASLFLFYAVRGYATPVLKDITNQLCPSAMRATIFSIRSLIIRFGFSLLGPTIGALTGRTSLGFALITAGCCLLVFSLFSALFLHHQLRLVK